MNQNTAASASAICSARATHTPTALRSSAHRFLIAGSAEPTKDRTRRRHLGTAPKELRPKPQAKVGRRLGPSDTLFPAVCPAEQATRACAGGGCCKKVTVGAP